MRVPRDILRVMGNERDLLPHAMQLLLPPPLPSRAARVTVTVREPIAGYCLPRT